MSTDVQFRPSVSRFSARGITALSFAGAVSLGVFLVAGSVKPLMPFFDLTLAAAVVTAVAALLIVAVDPHRLPKRAVLLFVAMFFVFVLAALWSGTSAYAGQKELRLFTLTALAAFAPFVLIRTESYFRAFVVSVVSIGIVGGVVMLVRPSTFSYTGRVSIVGNAPINASRLLALAALAVFISALASGKHLGPAILVGSLLVFGAINTGSRGPLLGLIVGGAVAVASIATGPDADRRVGFRTAAALAGLVASSFLAYSLAPEGAYSRLTNSVALQASSSDLTRLELFQAAAVDAMNQPLGTGWGTFTVAGYGPELYPHNLLLEVAVEAGWLALFLLVAVIVGSFRAVLKANSSTSWFRPLWLGLMTFALVNSMVSADMNGNRIVLSLAAIGMTVSFYTSQSRNGTKQRRPDR